jgi:ATP-dependent protease HslVU (ClpYQ) peptidase subunit
MTCIVGLKHHGKVYIGGDSLGVAGYAKVVRADEKVFVRDDMIFGFTSSFRMGQILRYSFTIPRRIHEDTDDMKYLVDKFIPAMMKCFDEGGYLSKHQNASYGGTFLLGYKNRLFKIDNDFQVGESTEDYDACGCGEAYALGSLFSTTCLDDPEERIKTAINAASTYSAGVGGKTFILNI